MKLVICEDELLVSLDLKQQLERAGHVVAACLSRGDELLEFLGEHEVDAIIMDIHLAGAIDGVEAVRRLRAFSEVPVIYLSGSSQLRAREAVQQGRGIAGWIDKPVRLGTLLGLLDGLEEAAAAPPQGPELEDDSR